jgi:translation initiation factor IF-2
MGKIRVQDLAKMMKVPSQDLIFKLKSIGVRIEGEDAHIDTDTLQAIVQGKKLPHPREVILRDQEAKAQAPTAARGRRSPRAPQKPLRPTRPRTLIQKKDSKIKTLPASERKSAPKPPEPEKPAQAPAPADAPKPEEVQVTPQAVAAQTEAPAAAPPAKDQETKPAVEAKEPKKAKAPKEVMEPEAEARKTRSKKKKGPKPEDDELASYRGAVDDLDEAEDEAVAAKPAKPKSKRRAERRKQQKEKRDSGEIVQFRDKSPEGPVMISENMTVRDFADKLGVKTKDLMTALFKRGVMANINHVLDPETATQLADELGIETMMVSMEEELQLSQELSQPESGQREPRAPVVTIMGHVDHGKTSLLDAIRESKVTESEHGGITQHIGAYRVDVGDKGGALVFLDTPGHEAFTMMRARGAKATDIVVLVVAADDGVMPQTKEAIDHARAAKVPIVVAINKIDKANANPDRVKKELADNELLVEDWGGDVVSVELSALKREGIGDLLEMILLTAEILELKATVDAPATGVVLEARKEVGRGTVATVLVQSGSLEVGDSFVSGATYGRVRSMMNDQGERVKMVGPSTPVEVAGFSDVPAAGDLFQVASEQRAREIASYRQEQTRRRDLQPTQGKMSLEQLFDRIQEGEVKDLPVVIKADVQGSVEVLKDTLVKLGTEKVRVQVIHSAVGAITTNDVLLASASEAIIVGFNVRPERNALELAEKEEVDIRLHTVIYEITDEITKAMVGLLDPTFQEVTRGQAQVRDTFKVPRMGTIAGCHVTDGVIPRNALVRLLRDNVVIYDGKISSLRRFKDDVSEVRSGFDCGIALERFQDIKPGDVIEAYEREEVAQTL